MDKITFVRKNFERWNKKTQINIGNNRLYKIVGSGPVSFKVLKFGPNEETTKPTWSQTWWKYGELSATGQEVINKMYKELGGK